MTDPSATTALIDRLQDSLQRLAVENYHPAGSCCACLQDVATTGHLPGCHLAQRLAEVAEWRPVTSK